MRRQRSSDSRSIFSNVDATFSAFLFEEVHGCKNCSCMSEDTIWSIWCWKWASRRKDFVENSISGSAPSMKDLWPINRGNEPPMLDILESGNSLPFDSSSWRCCWSFSFETTSVKRSSFSNFLKKFLASSSLKSTYLIVDVEEDTYVLVAAWFGNWTFCMNLVAISLGLRPWAARV